jgi:hypothetical protein
MYLHRYFAAALIYDAMRVRNVKSLINTMLHVEKITENKFPKKIPGIYYNWGVHK